MHRIVSTFARESVKKWLQWVCLSLSCVMLLVVCSFVIAMIRRSIIRRRRSVWVESSAATHPRQAVDWQFQSRVEVVPPH